MDTDSENQDISVTTSRVFCDGGSGTSGQAGGESGGHPGVYLNLGDEGKSVCPYCSKTYVLSPDAEPESSH